MSELSPKTPDPAFVQSCRDIVDHWSTGQLSFRKAVASLSRLLEQARKEGQIANLATVESMMGFLQGYRGNLNASIEHYGNARRCYAENDNALMVMITDLNIGVNYRMRGDFHRALMLYREVQQQAQELEEHAVRAMTLANEGLVLITLKRYKQALRVLGEVRKLVDAHYSADDRNWPIIVCEMYYALTLVSVAEKDSENAWKYAMESWMIADATGQPLHNGYANRTVALALDAQGGISPDPKITSDPDAYFEEASENFREVRAEAELGQTLYMHGISLVRRGHGIEAGPKLQQALVIFTRLGMVDDAARAAEAHQTLA